MNTKSLRWLFIIEGAGTMVTGVLAVFLLPDFPRSGQRRWLSEQEQRFAEWRLAQAANNEVDENGGIKDALVDAFTDPRAWMLVGIQICQLTSQTWTYFFPVSVFLDVEKDLIPGKRNQSSNSSFQVHCSNARFQ